MQQKCRTGGHVIREACRSMGEQAAARGLRLETCIPSDLPLRTDTAKACHALTALVSNAIKFTDTGSIRVSARREAGRVRFEVRDTGIGIAKENLKRIFDPYWQLESTVRRTHGGVGLGLSVARRLARLMGGDVTVRSTPAVGSEFVLDLPGG